MFSFGPTKANRKRPDWVLIINQHECSCVKAVAAKLSPIIKTFLKNNPNAKNFECEINDCEIDRDLISMLFFGKEIQFSRNNVDLLTKIAKGLEMTELHRDLANYQEYLHFIEDNIDRSYEINELIQCEEIIFNFSPYAIDACITNSLKFLNPYNEDVFARTLLSYCVARHYRIEQAVEFLVKLDKKLIQKNQNSIAAVFCNLVLREFKKEISSDGQRYDEYRSILQELCFIIYQLMLKNLIDSNALQQDDLILPLFFAHLMTPEKIQLAQKANIINKEDRYPSFTQIIKNVNIKDWTPAHLYNAGTGVNTFPMLLYIRQDNIEKFSQYAKTPQFKVDEKVLSNIYERCTFINDKPKLLEYAAFFGSKECFKFLLASGAEKTPGILRFAICSGNSDIIKLCDSPICTLLGSLSLAVEYHHQVVSEWLIEVKNQSCFDPIVIQNCLRFCNFHMLSYILKKGVNANLFLLEAVHYDNIPATKWLLEIKGINVNQQDTKRGFTPLHYAAQSGNIKIIGLLLGTNGIHINSRTFGLSGKDGLTPLHIACKYGNLDAVTTFLNYNEIDVNIQGKFSFFIYDECYLFHFYTGDVFSLIIYTVYLFLFYNVTALHLACKYNHLDIVKALLQHNGIDVNLKANYENFEFTALHFACKFERTEIVALLLSHSGIEIIADSSSILFMCKSN